MVLGEIRKKLIWSVYHLYPKSLNYFIHIKLVDRKNSFKHPRSMSSKRKRWHFLITLCHLHFPDVTLVTGRSVRVWCLWMRVGRHRPRAHTCVGTPPTQTVTTARGQTWVCLVDPFLDPHLQGEEAGGIWL